MAEENDENEPKGGKKNMVLLIVVGITLLAGGIGGTWFLMKKGPSEVASASDEPVPEPPAEPHYVSLDPAFVVNFHSKRSRGHFLKVELNALTYQEEIKAHIERHMPVIRNNIVLLFSRQIYEELLSHDGKEKLRQAALQEIQTILEDKVGDTGIDDLFFTSFVMQ